MIVGESPGRTEASIGRPFVGPSGELLRAMLKHADFEVLSCRDATKQIPGPFDGIEFQWDEPEVYFTNAALCLPLGQDADQYKTSRDKLMASHCCLPRLRKELKPYREVPMAAVGGAACRSMVGNPRITKIRSRWHIKGSTKIITTWHPAYILRQPVRAGELLRDLHKLAQGGPLFSTFPTMNYQIIESVDEFWKMARVWSTGCEEGKIEDQTICLDIESDNVDWWKDKILCIGFAWDIDQAAILPESLVYTDGAREVLEWLFSQPHIKWMGHNFKFDCRFIRYQLGVHNARVDYDSLIGDYILDENRRHALKDLLTEFYDVPDYEADLVQKYLESRNDMYSKVPRPELYKYCAYDVCYTMILWRDVRKQLEDSDLWEMPFLYPVMASQEGFLQMELHGMLVDRKQLTELSQFLKDQLEEWYEKMCELAKVAEFNPNSWMQVGEIMYDVFKMPKQKIRGLNPRSTASPVRKLILQEYEGAEATDCDAYRWIQLYDSWKALEKIRSGYVDNLIPLIDDNGRVHPDILMYGTETGRISVRNPALQTIPRTDTGRVEGELWGKRIKQCFTVPEGYKMVQVDFSQAELRTAAVMANDEFLMQCYRDGRDIHGEVANALWPGWYELEDQELKKYRRKRTKMCVFGRLYLGTAHTVAETLHCSLKEARQYLKVLDSLIGGVVNFEHEQLRKLKTQGYVETLTKRRRRMPLITRDNLEDARKSAANAPVQGMASDLTTISMIETHDWIQESGVDARLLITVHDSVILEVREEQVDMVARKIKSIMEDVGTRWMPQIPWQADMEAGSNWGELKEFE